MTGVCHFFLIFKQTHLAFKCKKSSCLAVRSGFAVVFLTKMEVITERQGSKNYEFSFSVVSVFSPFTLKGVTYKRCLVFLGMKIYNSP